MGGKNVVMAKRCDPTAATVRALYGSAFQCAFLDCQELLYRPSGGGQRIRNSHVAHIYAATPDGPRPLVPFDCDFVRSFENLLLMCEKHSSEIDQIPDEYPVEKLQQWKADQVALADSLQQGWQLTEVEVAELFGDASASAVRLDRAAQLSEQTSFLRSKVLELRQPVLEAADEWERRREEVNASRSIWNEQGELIRMAPSGNERRSFEAQIVALLEELVAGVAEFVAAVRGASAALSSLVGDIAEPFDVELGHCLDDLRIEIGKWPSDPDASLDALDEVVSGLAAVARGEVATAPELRPVPQDTAPDQATEFVNHLARLKERVAPFMRVATRDFDGDLVVELLEAAPSLNMNPETPHTMMNFGSIGCIGRGIAAVYRNASPEELRSHLAELRGSSLGVRAETLRSHLVLEGEREGERTQLVEIEAEMTKLATELQEALVVPSTWSENVRHMSLFLAIVREYAESGLLMAELVGALVSADDTVVTAIVESFASWHDSVDSETNQWLGCDARIRLEAIPQDLPVSVVAEALLAIFPDIEPLMPPFESKAVEDRTQRLAAEFLAITGS